MGVLYSTARLRTAACRSRPRASARSAARARAGVRTVARLYSGGAALTGACSLNAAPVSQELALVHALLLPDVLVERARPEVCGRVAVHAVSGQYGVRDAACPISTG